MMLTTPTPPPYPRALLSSDDDYVDEDYSSSSITTIFPPPPPPDSSSSSSSSTLQVAANISDSDWRSSVLPFIDEQELQTLEPKAQLYIIAQAWACNAKRKVAATFGYGDDDDTEMDAAGDTFTSIDASPTDELLLLQQQQPPPSSPASLSSSFPPVPLTCPRIFDGWSCWNETEAGKTASASCPWFITGFEPGRIAHKECLSDGTWFKHPLTNQTWSNYTSCVDLDALQVYQNVNLVYEFGYLVSVCALVLSLFIFCKFRSLSCTRVTLHKHLFASFITNNSLWLIWYRTVVNSTFTVNELNQAYCAVIHILTHYFMMANYFWMFCEGFYLHTLLVYAFTRAESKLLRWFYAFGWLGPALPLGLYTAFRGTDSDPTERKECWIHDSKWSLLISGPVCVCLVVSLAFLINIVRVLVLKLNASRRVTRTVQGSGRLLDTSNNDQQQQPSDAGATTTATNASSRNSTTRRSSSRRLGRRSRRESSAPGGDSASSLRKASRATLILIPLLGLHYFIIPFRPDSESNRWAAVTYEYVAAVTSSLQGLAVSLIFCFCNGEVLTVLRRRVCPLTCCRVFLNNRERGGRTTLQQQSPSSTTYHDYSCGGKLLRNMRNRVLRRGRGAFAAANTTTTTANNYYDDDDDDDMRRSSPTTTIMTLSSLPTSPTTTTTTTISTTGAPFINTATNKTPTPPPPPPPLQPTTPPMLSHHHRDSLQPLNP